jgi:hypothetical protein
MKQSTPRTGEPQVEAPPVDAPALEPHPPTILETHVQAAATPRVKVFDGRAIALDHPDEAAGEAHLMAALGTADRDFCAGVLLQLGDAASYGGKIDDGGLNFMLSVVKGVKPRDQVEAMLAAQMAVVHTAAMNSALQLARASTVVQQDFAERAINKLTRTFATQTEALKRYRSGGEPNVTVQNVSVSDGGQAIVGNVTTSRAAAGRAAPAGADPAGKAAARPRVPAPKRPAISPPAPADALMTQPGRARSTPAQPRRRVS